MDTTLRIGLGEGLSKWSVRKQVKALKKKNIFVLFSRIKENQIQISHPRPPEGSEILSTAVMQLWFSLGEKAEEMLEVQTQFVKDGTTFTYYDEAVILLSLSREDRDKAKLMGSFDELVQNIIQQYNNIEQ